MSSSAAWVPTSSLAERGANLLARGDGDDRLRSVADADCISGGAGIDNAEIFRMDASQAFSVDFSRSTNVLADGPVVSGIESVLFYSGFGNDRFLFGVGDDVIVAGAGNEGFVIGWSGDDIFVIGLNNGVDTIFGFDGEFQVGDDRLDLLAFETTWEAVQAAPSINDWGEITVDLAALGDAAGDLLMLVGGTGLTQRDVIL